MAQDRFLQRVDSLFGMLHLERQPGNVDDIHTLTVDGYLNIHVSGMDDQWILFFSEIPLPAAQRDAAHFCDLLELNLFPKHFPPIVAAYDKPTESVILWCCEMMNRVDDAELFQMFDRFFKEAENLSQEINNSGVIGSSRSIPQSRTGEEPRKPSSAKTSQGAKPGGKDDVPPGHMPFA